ncbi:MAG: efflux RND transporter periplasmic adaptor subunit [Rhizobium sp.]|nr:efflux RND transporter periplasmic adaptor subunit [Rhizobium sp.]
MNRLIAAVGLASCLVLSPCIALAQEAKRKVVIERPEVADITRYLQSTGSFSAVNAVDLVARVSGTLQEVRFRDGDFVRKGETIFVIEPEPYRISLLTAEADLKQQQANLEQAQANAARQETLSARQVVSESTRESADTQKRVAEAQLTAAEARLRSAALNLSYTEVKAPFDGILGARTADPGAFVNAASAPKLAVLIQPDPLHLNFSATEQEVILIRKALAGRRISPGEGNPIRVEAALSEGGGYTYAGTLDYIAPEIDRATGTLTLRALFPNPDRFLSSGMFARARIPLDTRRVVTIPERAIASLQGTYSVLVVDEGGVVQQRKVTLGDKTPDGRREILSGISEADRVVTLGLGGLRPGETVEIVDQI